MILFVRQRLRDSLATRPNLIPLNSKTCLVAVAVAGSLVFVWLWRDKMKLSETSVELEQVRSELARTVETARIHESEAVSLKDQLARLENDLARAQSALLATTATTAKDPPASGEQAKGQPLGLTTNDVILMSMQVTGSSNIGVLFVPLTGWALESVREFRTRRQPLVFGRLISSWEDYGVWGASGTNFGVGLRFKSRGEAEAAAAQLRAEGVE